MPISPIAETEYSLDARNNKVLNGVTNTSLLISTARSKVYLTYQQMVGSIVLYR